VQNNSNSDLILSAYRREVLANNESEIIEFITPEQMRAIGLLKGCSDIIISDAMSQVWDEQFRRQFFNQLGFYPTLKIHLINSPPIRLK
jgi:hypothetical protein